MNLHDQPYRRQKEKKANSGKRLKKANIYTPEHVQTSPLPVAQISSLHVRWDKIQYRLCYSDQ